MYQPRKNHIPIDIKCYSPKICKLSFNYGWGANILAIDSEYGLLLVDSGYKKMIDHLQKILDEKYDKAVIKIINTHFHGDHIGGNSIISPDGELIVHKNTEQRKFYLDNYTLIGEPTQFDFGSESIKIHPLPYGHSPTDMLIFLKKSNIVHTGDLYLSESFPLVSLDKSNSVYTLKDNLEFLLNSINDETIIVSGHGRDTNKTDLKKYILMVKETIQIIEKHIKKGQDKKEIKRLEPLKKYHSWSGNIEFITSNSWIENIWRSYHNHIPNPET